MSAILVQPGSLVAGQEIELSADELHHLRVRRASPGERVRLVDGLGTVGLGELMEAGESWRARIDHVTLVPAPDPLSLVVGAGDRDRFVFVVEKGTELGATEIVAMATERSRSVAGRVRAEHLDKLSARAVSAFKQCGGAWLPKIRGPVPFEDALDICRNGSRWLASASDEHMPAPPGRGAMAIMVGPEGGLTSNEREAAMMAGWEPVRLARGTLRFETAAIAAMSLVAAARFQPGRDH